MELLPLVCLCLLSCSGDGALQKPSVKILDEKDDKMLLQCEVQGTSPKPTVVWQTLAGKVFPSMKTEVTKEDGSYSIIIETTVSKNGLYYCVAGLDETDEVSVSGSFGLKRGDHLETLKKNQFRVLQIVLTVVGLTFSFAVVLILIIIYIKRKNAGSPPESTVAL